MTAPTIAEDFMFDLDLRIIPVEESGETPLSPNASGGCISGMGSIRPCSTGCPTYYTCTRCQ